LLGSLLYSAVTSVL